MIDGYLHGHGAEAFTDDGWFQTGDVAIASPGGYFVIADRTKDLIKSGGEWISSVDMEAAIMEMDGGGRGGGHRRPRSQVAGAPAGLRRRRTGASVSLEDVRAHLRRPASPSWQLPDRIEVIDAVPNTSVGKFDKKALRARFG